MPLTDKHFFIYAKGSDFTSKRIIKAFRLSEVEAMNLAKSAACHGMKESNYVRQCIARGPKDNKEIMIILRGLMNELQLIGRNINQIVKNNNSGLYLQSDKDALLAYMKRLYACMLETKNIISKMEYDYLEDFENGMGPDEVILYMNQFRGSEKNQDYVMDLVKKGISVSTAVKITKKYCSEDTLEAVFTWMENGMPIAVIEKEYNKKSFISRMKSYMDSLAKDKTENNKIKQSSKENIVNDNDDKYPDSIALFVGDEMMKKVNVYIPFLKDPYDSYVGRVFMRAAEIIYEHIPSVKYININMIMNRKMAGDLVDYILNSPDDKIDTAALEMEFADRKLD